MSTPSWTLHPQLDADTIPVGELALSRLLLAKDANFPWLILVPRRDGIREIIDLDELGQAELAREIAVVSRALKAAVPCDKLNVAALGNMVPQLHVHIIARRRGDPAWPKPVWGVVPAREYDPATRERLIAALREVLWPDR
ncbi:MAG: HIT family protein [Xanthobacteraceae bacterium]|nr:HIT family protein [Xanthobacteraceae bacterium]